MKTLLGIVHILLFTAIEVSVLNAQTPAESLDSVRVRFERQAAEARSGFAEYEASVLKDYQEYTRQAVAEMNRYVRSIGNVWGEDNIILDSKTEWVEYSPDFRDRSIVDFDNGTVTVEVVLDADIKSYDSDTIDRLLENAVTRVLESRGSTCPYSSVVDISEPLTGKPILEGLIDTSMYRPEQYVPAASGKVPDKKPAAPPAPVVKSKRLEIDTKTVPVHKALYSKKKSTTTKQPADKQEYSKAALAKSIVSKSSKTVVQDSGNDGKETYTARISFNLASDNLSRNAALYTDLVMEFSEKFMIEPSLVFAVMEQESRFNPEATSWVPAYGLMQLVPESGGFDAYRYVYGKEWIPTKSYLFNPRHNIELGTAYLRILSDQFKRVDDFDCRRLCVIAGYNTGAGNVSRAFTGNTNLSKAFDIINGFDYDGLYDHLRTQLKSEEARNYVTGVTRRMEKYTR